MVKMLQMIEEFKKAPNIIDLNDDEKFHDERCI